VVILLGLVAIEILMVVLVDIGWTLMMKRITREEDINACPDKTYQKQRSI
jgi:hypothetical protein